MLNKDKKYNFEKALFYLQGGFKDKTEISVNDNAPELETKSSLTPEMEKILDDALIKIKKL